MFARLWELMTSDDKVEKLVSQFGVIAAVIITICVAAFVTSLVFVGVGVLLLGAIAVDLILHISMKKSQEQWREILHSEDDGVTGYIKVRPGELDEGLPWEANYKPKQTLFSEQEEQS
jgi:hypothetical protein